MTGSKRKKTNTIGTTKKEDDGEYTAERFIKGLQGMSNKEIKRVINLVDDGLKFSEAVEQVTHERILASI